MSVTRPAVPTVLLCLGFVFVLALVALPIANGYHDRRTIVSGQRASCRSQIADRLSTIEVRTIQAESAQAIAADPFQSKRTRAVRGEEAAVLRASVDAERTRVDPEHGGALDCTRAFPAPSLVP